MTSLNLSIKQITHKIVKPFTRMIAESYFEFYGNSLNEKERKGWDLETVTKFRAAFADFEAMTVNVGTMETPASRRFLRQIFDVLCLQADVEGQITVKRWGLMKECLRKQGLI